MSHLSCLKGINVKIMLGHDHGFFSNCTVLLMNMILGGGTEITSVDTTSSFGFYKEDPEEDIYATFFKPFSGRRYETFPMNAFWCHERYSNLPLEKLLPWTNDYFQLSDEVLLASKDLATQYAIDIDKTAAVFLRGGDKVSEVPPIEIQEVAEALNKLNPADFSSLLIQSNDLSLRAALIELITVPIRIVTIDEDPSVYTAGSHQKFAMKSHQSCTQFLAIVHLISQCKEVMLNSGNVSFWIVLFRGSMEGVTHFFVPPTFYTPTLGS